jgi:hypothetical protein
MDASADTRPPRVDYRTEPSRYRHWQLKFEGAVATLAMNVDEDGGLRPGYKLKLNSYDLGVDIELHDALNRIRFEHPEVRAVVDIPRDLAGIRTCGEPFSMMRTSFFLGRQKLIASRKAPGMALWREKLFAWMLKSSESAMEFFKLPTNRVVELGSQLQI